MSSNVDSGMLKNILKGILRSSSALTFGSTVLPSTSSTPRWKQVTARKIPPLSQWFVERHNFEEAVTAEYASMQPSEIRLVVAGTGVGKTTKLPYSIAKTHQVCGIVLMPEFDFMLDTHAYMAGNSMYSAVRFDRLRSSVIRQPDAGVTVYYSTAADFLSHLTNHPDLCATLRIGFIFLDEQHVPRPDYTFIPYLVDAGILKGIKVLYGTATANSSADISMEGGVKRTMIKKPASHFPSDPRDVKPGYPMHESQIVSRTIIFLADESEIQAWLLYYEAHDVPTVVYGHASSPDMLSMVRKHLENNPVSVCLTCRLETTVTLNVDVAIDAGRSLRLVYDMENAAVKLHIAPATNAQQTQRAGRVARYKPGTVFKAEVPNSPPADPYSYEQSVYIFLWAKKFNITIRQPAVAMWEEPFGNLTQVNTAILLSSRIPPLLQYAYLSDDGLFSGWDHMKKLLYDPTGVRVTLDSCSKAVQGWTELSTGPQPFMTAPAVFRVRITPPREWLPLFYWAYVQYMESDDCADDFDARTYAPSVTTRSVIVPRASLTRKDTVKSRDSVIQNQATPEIRDLRQTIDARSVCYSTAEPFTMKGFNFKPTNRITEVEEDDMVSVSRDRNNEIDKWAQQASALSSTEIVPRIIGNQPEKRPRRGSIVDRVIVQSDSSQSSSEQDRLILRRVDPMKYSFVKLYPADEGILHKFLARQNVEPVDKHRLYDLLDAKKNFSTLERAFEDRRDVQMSYFLSIIRMHNKFVMELAQLSATDASARRYGYSRLQRKKDSLQDDIGSSSKLLKMCEMENLFVAIDSRTRHSATPISATRFTTRSFSTDHARALFGMIAGDPAVKRKVDRLVDSVVPVMTTDEHGTDYVRYHIWLNGSVINAVTHCFENERGEFEMPDSVESVVSKQGELVIFGSKSPYPHQTECADIHDVQEVYVLAVRSTDERDVCVMGPYDVYAVGDTWHISSDFIFGYSGALCVCTRTGLPTALYVGSYIEVDNKLHGTVVSLV